LPSRQNGHRSSSSDIAVNVLNNSPALLPQLLRVPDGLILPSAFVSDAWPRDELISEQCKSFPFLFVLHCCFSIILKKISPLLVILPQKCYLSGGIISMNVTTNRHTNTWILKNL
ncbi:hypothetical protein OESDEN_06935, partial [Oesophagostomum dentatum]